MELTPLESTVLQVLSIQSPGYLTSSFASAFVAVGLEDPKEIEDCFVGLQDKGLVEFYTDDEHVTVIKAEKDADGNYILDENDAVKPVLDEDGNVQTEVIVQTVDSGWIITDKGREAIGVTG